MIVFITNIYLINTISCAKPSTSFKSNRYSQMSYLIKNTKKYLVCIDILDAVLS